MKSSRLTDLSRATVLGVTALSISLSKADGNIQWPQNPDFSTRNDSVILGTAYHSERDGFYALQSVLGKVDETYGNTEMNFVVGVDMDYTKIANMVNGSLGAQLDVPAIKVGVGATYAKNNAADDYTGTYTLFLSLKPKKRLLLPSAGGGYTPTQVAIESVNDNPGNKFNVVGDEFVSGVDYGSQVMVNLKFQYKNKVDKVAWGGQINVDWVGKVKVGGKLKKVDNEVKKNIKVTVSATQLGGDPNRLLSVIPNQLINCTMENPEPCFDIFKNTITYIKTDYVRQFPTLDRYNVNQVFTNKYLTSGPDLAPLLPDDDYPEKTLLTKLSVKSMSDAWVRSLLDNRRAENLLSYYAASLTPNQRNLIENIREYSLFNSFLLSDAVAYCKRNPIGHHCRNRELETKGNLNVYDRSPLEL